MQHLYETDSESSDLSHTKSKVSELRNLYNTKTNMSDTMTIDSDISKRTDNQEHVCNICNQKSGQFIILNCNHIFHTKCLAEINFQDVYKYPVIDTEYFESRCCPICQETMQTEDLMHLHSKFLSSTKRLIGKHQHSIENLENQLKQIKLELRTCYDYKHKLEQEREKSKQIVSVLTTMI